MDKGKSYSDSEDEGDEIGDLPVRADTPGPMPQFMYTREKLYDLSETNGSKMRPKVLLKAFDNADGLWDPEKWSHSFGSSNFLGSRENSPLTVGDPRDRRRSELDRESLRKRASDPRLKEERDNIMLCPQRRSFGTGCHVTQSPSVGRQVSCPADFKDGNDRERDRRERRIGSGRITIDRDQGREREYRNVRDRYERDDRRPRQERTFERSTSYHNSSFDNRASYRDRESRFSRDPRDNRGNRRGRMQQEEEEPEWFSAGPTSQHDTIELRGFEKEPSPEQDTLNQEEDIVEEDKEEPDNQGGDAKTGISVADRNGSLETNESSSPEVNHETRPSPNTAYFDINDMFKSGLLDDHTVEPSVPSSGSRFTHFFTTQQQHHSKENSRRSSINEEFKYLDDMIEGSRSPLIPSPVHAYYNKPENFYAQYGLNMTEKQAQIEALQQQKNSPTNPVLSMFMNSAHMDKSNTPVNFNPHDAEAQLKAMLFRGRDSNSSSGTASPAMMGGGARKVKTLAELEATFHHESPTSNMSPVQQLAHQQAQGQQQQHLQHAQQLLQQYQHAQHHINQYPQHPQHYQPHPPQQPQHLTQSAQQQHHTPEPKANDDGDLTAFNKLLSMMQAGAAAAVEGHQQQQQMARQPPHSQPELPKQMQMGGAHIIQGADGRPVSPLQQQLHQLQQHNNHDFLQQALIRNKEQQLHIQQQTLQHMQRHQMPQQQQQNIIHSQSQQLPQPMIPPQQTQTHSQPTRAITHDPILSFIQQNPTIITKPPSPSPTIPTLMPTPSTPRVVSPSPQPLPPNLLQKQVQQPQQIPGGKVPSPIMFSQQPPMHLNAPSPIHPAQIARSLASQPLSPNTLSTASANIHPQNVARVPSPQELIAHTQAIMQSALIKKQLEDQKERFLKKQQERARSPNQNRTNISPQSTPAGVVQVKPATSPAFTPTSVMRKMHSDRASEKEKGTKECDMITDELSKRSLDVLSDKLDAEEQARQDAEEIASLPGIDFSTEPNQTMTSLEEKLKLAGISSQSLNKATPILGQGDKSSRPLIGQGMMQGTVPSSTPGPGRPIVKAPTTPATTPGQFRPLAGPGAVSTPVRPENQRAIVGTANISPMDMAKVLEQQRIQQQQQQAAAAAAAAAAARQAVNTPLAGRPVGVGSNAPFGIPITGRLPVQSNMHATGTANALLMQQMMQQGSATTRGLNLNQLNQISQLAALQQAQQRMVDPRLQGVRYPAIVQPMLNPRSTATAANIGLAPSPAVNAVLGRALSPGILSGQKLNVSGPLSPNMSCTSPAHLLCNPAAVNGNNNISKTPTSDPNILKWFSSDVLKNHMPTMPPLPTQGQKVLTVDDLEGT